MCNPVIPLIAGAAYAGHTALKSVGKALKPNIDMPAPPPAPENTDAAAANAAQNARRRAMLAYGANRTQLAGGSTPSGGGKTLLGS